MTASLLGPVYFLGANHESQGRGLQHSHAETWVEGAPIIGESTEEEICEFVTKYVTCHIPDSTLSPTLYERVITLQQHKCNDYCLRSKKTNAGVKRCVGLAIPGLSVKILYFEMW